MYFKLVEILHAMLTCHFVQGEVCVVDECIFSQAATLKSEIPY